MTIYLTILLVLSISLAVLSIFFCTWALGIRSYTHAFLPDSFFSGEKANQKLDHKAVKEFAERDEDGFYDEMIEEYLESNKENKETNHGKAKKIKIGQYLFLAALAIVPILVAITITFSPLTSN